MSLTNEEAFRAIHRELMRIKARMNKIHGRCPAPDAEGCRQQNGGRRRKRTKKKTRRRKRKKRRKTRRRNKIIKTKYI